MTAAEALAKTNEVLEQQRIAGGLHILARQAEMAKRKEELLNNELTKFLPLCNAKIEEAAGYGYRQVEVFTPELYGWEGSYLVDLASKVLSCCGFTIEKDGRAMSDTTFTFVALIKW